MTGLETLAAATNETFAPIAAARARTAPGSPNAANASTPHARPRRLRRPAGLVGPPRGDERLRRRRDRAVQRCAPRQRAADAARSRASARRPAARPGEPVRPDGLARRPDREDRPGPRHQRQPHAADAVPARIGRGRAANKRTGTPGRSCCTPTSPTTSATTGRRASCSTTSSATGARSRSTSRASTGRARGRGGACATPSCASAARCCSQAGCCRCSSAMRCRRARCRTSWRAASPSRRWTGSPARSPSARWPTPAPARCARTARSSPCSTTTRRARQLAGLSEAEADESPLFTQVRELGEELQSALLALLFEDRELEWLVRDYLIF